MPNRHQQIPLAAAASGMTLSDAVLDTKGNVLLPKGTLLTDGMLASLLRHQIATVVVIGGEVSAEEDSAERERRVARLEYLFRASDSTAPGLPASTATNDLHQHILRFRSSASS